MFGLGNNIMINPWLLLTGQKLTGSFFGGYKPIDGIKSLISQYLSGKLNLDQFITHRITLDQINDGLDLMRNGKTIRTVIEFK